MADCGTGIGQVLAILYVVCGMQTPNVIAIDEPSSFLHPSAVRELLRTFGDFAQHQFVISTHAPEIISSSTVSRLLVAEWTGLQTEIKSFPSRDLETIKHALDDVGVRLSDIYGYDSIIWVEGATEAACFPLLLGAAGVSLPPRWAFIPVVNTGDFDRSKGDARVIWQIYRRLSQRSALVPETVAFSFDRETRSEKTREDLKRESGGQVHFLPRRTFENYLLDVPTIARFLNKPPALIMDWIKVSAGQELQGDVNDAAWVRDVDAPKLLTALFKHFSNATQEYRKTEHSVALFKDLLTHEAGKLQELTEYVRALVSSTLGSHDSSASPREA